MKCQRCQQDKPSYLFSKDRSICNDCHFEIESAYFEDTEGIRECSCKCGCNRKTTETICIDCEYGDHAGHQ